MPTPGNDQIEELYDSAKEKWPGVNWDLAAFRKHLGGQFIDHPEDLYLGGAAGYRLDAAWESIEQNLGPRTRRVLTRQPTADYSIDDLWGDAVAKLMDEDDDGAPLPDGRLPARIIRYRGQAPLLNYFIVVAKRLAIQRHRKARDTASLSGGEGEERALELPDPRASAPETGSVEAETVQRMRQGLLQAFGNLSAEQQFLIMMVYRQGMKKKDAGDLLGWSPFKTTRSLGAAMDRLHDSLKELAGVAWTPALASAWEECLKDCWVGVKEVQVVRARASESRTAGSNNAAGGRS